MKEFKASIEITLRESILDVQGKAVEQALKSIEFDKLSNVRIGKFVTLTVAAADANEAKSMTEKACEKLIANPIIEDYKVTIQE